MPLALVGLPWLASMIMGFVGGLLSWLGQYLSKRVLIIAALIASWGAAFAVLKGATIGLAAAGSVVLPAELTAISGVIIPSNLGNFLSTWGGIEFACVVYKVHLRVLGFKAQV